MAYPYLRDFCRLLQGMDYQFLLSDSKGYLLKCIFNGESLRALSRQNNVVEGRLLTEESSGTNGISFCLAAGEAIQVIGPEHYLPEFHIFACVAAPIFDPAHRLVGCLSIMGTLENHHPFMMAMLQAAAGGIERELYLSQNNLLLSAMLDSFKSAVLLLDREGVILRENQLATVLFHRESGLKGLSLNQLIQQDTLPAFFRTPNRRVDAVECTLILLDGTPLNVSVTLRPLADTPGGPEGVLLILDRQDELHRITNRLFGNYTSLTFDSLITASPAMETVKSIGNLAARSDRPVLIFGEKGTGKASLAQAIHQAGNGGGEPFLTLNCTILNKDQLRRELFGCESTTEDTMAYPGGPGKLELAGTGTVFLAEPGALPMELQQELLQTLQKKEVVRPGGRISKAIRCRIIASTSTDLLAAVQNGSFLGDLYYLFHTFSIVLPPLRQRQEDLLTIAKRRLEGLCKTFGKEIRGFSPECRKALSIYPWPGNIAELEKVIEQAVSRAEGSNLSLRDLPEELVRGYLSQTEAGSPPEGGAAPEEAQAPRSPDMLEYGRIVQVLRQEHGHMKTAAEVLGIPLSSLYRKVQKYGIDWKEYRAWR